MDAKATAKSIKEHEWTDGGDKVLILRRIDKSGTSRGGFKWPEGTGMEVVAPDFNTATECGGGLHGWPWGMGLGEGVDYNLIEDRWIVLAARPEDVVGELEGGLKCKCRAGVKLFDGPFAGAWAIINGGRHRLIEAMAKDASAGEFSRHASAVARSRHASAGARSQHEAAGENSSVAAAGFGSKAKVGKGGAFALAYKLPDGSPRFVCGKEGEDGIKADVWYEVRDGKLVEA